MVALAVLGALFALRRRIRRTNDHPLVRLPVFGLSSPDSIHCESADQWAVVAHSLCPCATVLLRPACMCWQHLRP